VAGDFNALWGDRELQLFLAASGLTSANVKSQSSYPSRNPHRELDYIFHSPEIRSTAFQVPKIKLSDHVPLVWDFEIDSPKTEEIVLGYTPAVIRSPGLSAPLTASV
jgi:endonuclease/exonuclease/phosphatase (EEP) superfamily protein YafD